METCSRIGLPLVDVFSFSPSESPTPCMRSFGLELCAVKLLSALPGTRTEGGEDVNLRIEGADEGKFDIESWSDKMVCNLPAER